VGHNQADGSGKMDLFLPLRDHRHLQPPSGWLVCRRLGKCCLFKPLFQDAVAKHAVNPGQLTLHADRGPSMKAKATAFLLADLGVTKSHSRPHTSNDNPFSESHFKTMNISRNSQNDSAVSRMPRVLSRLFPMVQLRPPPSRHWPDDARPGALRTGRRSSCSAPEHSRPRLPD